MDNATHNNGALSIFLVDDDATFLRSLEHHLQQRLKAPVQIQSFSTGEACLMNIQKKPDIVVLDYFLDSRDRFAMNGLQVLEWIQRSRPEAAVIMLSAHDKLPVAVEALKTGAIDYVVKNENVHIKVYNAIRHVMRTMDVLHKLKRQKRTQLALLSAVAAILIIAALFVLLP